MPAYIFDFDGVIRHWDNPNIVGQAERENGLPDGAIFAAAFEGDLLAQATTGQISDEAWREDVVRRLQEQYPDANGAAAVAAWSEPFGELIPGSREILERARHYGTVCLLSNATSRLASDLASLGIDGHFDHVFNSAEIGFAKPDQRVYEHIELELGLAGDQIVYVDDAPANIEAAAERGWVSLLASPANTLSMLMAPLLDSQARR